MRTNMYLYNTEDVTPIPKEVADERIKLLITHRDELLKVPRAHRAYMQLNAVLLAISFWEKLSRGEVI